MYKTARDKIYPFSSNDMYILTEETTSVSFFNKLTISSRHLQVWILLFNIIYHVDLVH